ncbi:MAG: hypothetical protein NTW03_03815 [Verrucomicrobia bacterium]|nr:hypothetical protein [Verrucomicrobiota bacterium]
MRNCFLLACGRLRLLALFCLGLGGLAGVLPAATLADFGYQNMRIHNQPALGVRPLLLILATFDNRPAFAYPPAHYQSLVFSASTPSVYGYHREVSHARFLWSMASYQPLTLNQPFERCWHGYRTNLLAHGYPTNAATDQFADRLVISNVVWQVMLNGFDFRPFDTNFDGTVQEHELSILLISNENQNLGATRSSGPVNPPAGHPNAIVNMDHVAHVNHWTEFRPECVGDVLHFALADRNQLCQLLPGCLAPDATGLDRSAYWLIACRRPGGHPRRPTAQHR